MTKFTKEQLIEGLKASTQNSSGMFEIGEDTICALMYLLADTPELVYVPDVAYSDDCPDLYPSQPDAWAEGWNSCRAAMLQGGNHTEQHLEMVDHSDDANKMVAGNSPVIPDDVRRMDWLVSKTVDVREPMVYGSHSLFWSQTITDEEDDYHATKLREQIDAAMAAEQAAAPQQEAE